MSVINCAKSYEGHSHLKAKIKVKDNSLSLISWEYKVSRCLEG